MGRYIVVEGNDGTGKSTQLALLAEWFQEKGHEVVMVEEPGSDDPEKSTPVANELRRVIKNGQLERAPEINVMLFSAARRELWQQKIVPALERDAVVLSARNYYSTLAYQGYGEGLDVDEIVRLTELFTDERYMQPDASVILLTDNAVRQQRIAGRGLPDAPDTFESRELAFQGRVDAGYMAIATRYGIPVVDAGGDVAEAQAEIRRIITVLEK